MCDVNSEWSEFLNNSNSFELYKKKIQTIYLKQHLQIYMYLHKPK